MRILIIIGAHCIIQCSVEIAFLPILVVEICVPNMAKNKVAVQVNIVGRDGRVGPPVFLTSPGHHTNVTSQCLGNKEIGSSVSITIEAIV